MIVKVCGMREAINIRQVEQAGADWMGFIFHKPSPRFLSRKPSYLPQCCKRVGVWVEASVEEILTTQAQYGLNMVQLHGKQDYEFCVSLKAQLPQGVGIIRSLPVASTGDLEVTDEYEEVVDYFLLDTKNVGMDYNGGTGRKFDWGLLDNYHSYRPFLLSGGISREDAPAILGLRHPRLAGVDINSRFETSPGLKNVASIKEFITTIKK